MGLDAYERGNLCASPYPQSRTDARTAIGHSFARFCGHVNKMPVHSEPMISDRAIAVRFLSYVALYVIAAEFSVVFVALPTDVTLIWPSAGVAFAVIIFHGPRWWPVIPLGILITHLLITPAPWSFIPFSLLSNTFASVVGASFVRRFGGDQVMTLRVHSGFVILLGGIVSATLGSLIGAIGLVYSGMVPAAQFVAVMGKWLSGDLFGIVVVTPFMLMAMRSIQRRSVTEIPLIFGNWVEKTTWVIASLAGIALIVKASSMSPAYALGLSFVPLTLLLWAALRFEPIFTAGATMVFAFIVVTMIGLSVAGFSAPRGLLESSILLALLSVMAIVPQLVAVANFRVRAAAFEMLHRARTDRLTGLPNRTSFEEALADALAARNENSRGGALAYIDFDEFKIVNDTASHAAGDEAIRQLASVLRAVLPSDVLLARLGADEFGVIWQDAEASRVETEAKAMRDSVADFRFAHAERVFALTASLGVVPFPPHKAYSAELLAQADTACYTAKELGGNRVQWLTAETQAVHERTAAMGWAVRINDALDNDRFELYGQRILSFDSDTPDAYEVLLRLRDENGEMLLPGRFIPAAERFALSSRLDRHVVERSLQWLDSDPRAKGLRLNINLSAASLADEDFAQFLRQRLRSGSIDPAQLCFEITETSAVRDLSSASLFIANFKALGVRFALDDFGTGFCSFAYLRELDVDVFKIDGSFVLDLDTSELSLAIVSAIVEIARVLGKRTVAESVENTAIGMRLQELGVHAVQGFAYHHPEPLRMVLTHSSSLTA